MPKNEIKNTFIGGKMNKDLDERLIPVGEYRDAMNVQVTTSDGSDVGSLHNIMGNKQVSGVIPNLDDAFCIGSIADEKTNKLYWMIEGLGNWNQISPGDAYYKADAIVEYDHDQNIVSPVVVDIHEVQLNFGAIQAATTTNILDLTASAATYYTGKFHVGMVVNGYAGSTIEFTTSIVDITAGVITLGIDISSYLTPFLVDRIVFTSEQRALNFNKDYLITGINIIDDQLFWTDDNSEPKRIHIDRYRDVGTTSFDIHSFTPTKDYNYPNYPFTNTFHLLEEHITVIRQKPLSAPQLLMDNSTATGTTEGMIVNDTDATSGASINSIEKYEEGDVSWIDFSGTVPDFKRGNILNLTTTTNNISKNLRVKVGDPNDPNGGIWYPNFSQTQPPAHVCASGIAGSCTAFMVEILSADPSVTITDTNWHAELEQDPPLFEFKFPRFATRYKYTDGEYSAFGPFSEVAFLPDRPGGADFDFVAYKGYNIGMTNQIRNLALKDFIPEKDLLPDDVIEIDILYKESNSPNVYSILTVKPDEEAWQTRVTYIGNRTNITTYPYTFSGAKGYIPIESEMIHGVLPSNQMLRPWDNVPRKAKAQEVSGNRLIYGNYLQNYDLLDAGNQVITPSLTISKIHHNIDEDMSPEQVYPVDSYKYSPSKSIKSLRTYQLGITYIDKYGRETPILTDNNDKRVSLYLNQWWADKQVKLTGQVNSNPPDWAEYYKFFIKETSNEYYNLAMDRWYDADDGNIWLSFPSSERNKVDIDTYLVLKKEHDDNTPVLQDARYKILAIENEAPDFIKTRRITIGTVDDDVNTTASTVPTSSAGTSFGPIAGNGFPAKSLKFIELLASNTSTTGGFDGKVIFDANQQIKGDIFVRFRYEETYTEWYEITNAVEQSTSTPAIWNLDLDRELGDDVSILTNDVSDPWNMKKSPLHAEFIQKRVYEAPEFDGRFFVKIHSDGIVRERILKPDPFTSRYGIVAANKVQYINTLPITPLTSGGGVPGTTWWLENAGNPYTNTIGTQYTDNNNGWDGWQAIYSSSGWPIQNPDLYHVSTGGQAYWEKFRTESGSRFFIDRTPHWYDADWSNYGHVYLASSEPSIGDGTYNAPSWFTPSRGIHNNGDSYHPDPWSIHLSYAGFDENTSGNNSNWGSEWESLGIDLVDRFNSTDKYVDEIRFLERLTTAGTLWKWGEDPDEIVYVTTGTTHGNRQETPNTSTGSAAAVTSHPNADWYTLFANQNDGGGWNMRNRWSIHAKALHSNGSLGSGPHGYLPTNDPNWAPHFDQYGDPILTYPSTHTAEGGNPLPDPAPGIRFDGMPTGETVNSNTIPDRKKWDSTSAVDGDWTLAPGSVTWQILEAVSTTELKHSSRNPAIFETEPKEDLDLEIYHEVGQTYPIEFNAKTNELYIPIGSVVECWRPINTPWVLLNPSWNATSGGYTGNDPIPVGNINIGGNPTNISFNPPWIGPIIVDQVGDNTVTLVDDIGTPFGNPPSLVATDWPEVCILPGDHLKFIRPDGSATSARVTAVNSGLNTNIYTIEKDISNRTVTLPWFNCYAFGNGVESNRIRDDYNQVTIDKGPRVSSVLDEPYKKERKLNGLIYSGIYNSISGVNNLNQFIQAEKITKDLNPTFGSIQKLFQRHINLIAFCEDRVIKILSNKDALYNADGNSQVTATSRVLGDAQPYVGDFGISKNPESFASENYRAYFADKQRGVVLRLSKDGLTPISDHGMVDWFRDNLSLSNRLIGGFDIQKREYNITLPDIARTLSFREDVKGWTSFKSFIPENSVSLAGKYYTFNKGSAWKHHDSTADFNTFYGIPTPSHVTTIFNTDPKSVKNFQTLNYEGSQSRVDQLIEYVNPNDNILYTDPNYHNLELDKLGWYVSNIHTDMQDGALKEFIKKEGKWFNHIRGEEIPVSATGQVASGFDYDPNEFSWQGIGLSTGNTSINLLGGCTDPTAANYGCATLLHPNSLIPCMGSSPDINDTCRDGTICTGAGCCGTNNGYDPIDVDDGTCDITGAIYGCLSNPNSINYNCIPSNTNYPCNDGVTHDDGSCIGIQGCTNPTLTTNYNSIANLDCNGDDITLQGYTPQPGWDQCCTAMVFGCLHPTQFNYANFFGTTNPANTGCDNSNMGCFPPNCTGPGSTFGDCCEPIVFGCLDPQATNTCFGCNSPQANNCFGSQTILSHPLGCNCEYNIPGCMDNTQTTGNAITGWGTGTWPDLGGYGSDAIYDCTSPTWGVPTNSAVISLCPWPCANGYYADNYNPCANVSTTCTGPSGCMNLYATNYDPNAYTDDGSCTYGCCSTSFGIVGSFELTASLGPGNTCSGWPTGLGPNFELTITQPDGFTYTDPSSGINYFNYQNQLFQTSAWPVLVIDPSVIAAQGNGTWSIYVEYTFPNTTIPQCSTTLTQAVIVGCTDNTPGPNPDINGNCNTSAPCTTLGCCGGSNGYSAEQYNPNATVNDGSCSYPIFGCTDSGTVYPNYTNFTNSSSSAAENYDPTATVDDGSCLYRGCTTASNTSGGIASNYFAYYNLDCDGQNINALGYTFTPNSVQDACCTFGTTGCTNNAVGCHPDINGHCNDAIWDHATQTYTTPGTTCSGSFCCGGGNGYKKDNYNPGCDHDPTCSNAGCTSVVNQGCGQQYLPFGTGGSHLSYNYNPCVTTTSQTQWCVPVVQGCMDSTALNYGSYSQNNPFGSFSNNTWFGTTAPVSNSGNTWNYAGNPTAAQNSQYGHHGPNTPGGPAGCGGVNWATNPCSDCVYAVFGCMDPLANNYDSGATVDQISQTNTNSPCCYDHGCILPNALAVLPAGSLPDITAVNVGSTGCHAWVTSSGTSGSLNDCYGNMVDVSSITVAGTATGTTVGNGVQLGNTMNVALNGGNTCADGDCDVPGGSAANAFHLFTNQDGHLDPGNVVPNPSNMSSLTTNWANIHSGTGSVNDCCDYYDGCSDPCAQNFNPQANTSPSAQTCTFGTVSGGWHTNNPPPWQNIHPCTSLTTL